MRSETHKLGQNYLFVFWFFGLVAPRNVIGVEIVSKSKLEKCQRNSDDSDDLNCTKKIVLDMATPSGSSGGEASVVEEIVEVEENSTQKMQTLRVPPVLTVNKSAAYALYKLTYIRDVSYKPEEYYVKTRKCEPDASEKVVKICERLRDQDGHIVEQTQEMHDKYLRLKRNSCQPVVPVGHSDGCLHQVEMFLTSG